MRAPTVFSQNVGLIYQVQRGMTMEEAEKVMGVQPVSVARLRGVEEWRYCTTTLRAHEYGVLYFHEGRLVDRGHFTISLRQWEDSMPAAQESCRERVEEIYTDGRKPPARVRELRGKSR